MPVFKKALQIVTTFGVLLAAYAGYVQVFAIVASILTPAKAAKSDKFVKKPSSNEQQALEYAIDAFGPGHWAADNQLTYRYYNHERGYWMYAKEYEKSKDGKQLIFTPFALIWSSQDGRGMKTVTSNRAVVDLNQPIGLSSSKQQATPLQVVHAKIEGDVRIRDDKGTPATLEDDLVIGPMTYIEYDEPTLQVKSESEVVLEEKNIKITGYGLEIKLRPKDASVPVGGTAGFNGAETAILHKNPHVVLKNSESGGLLPTKPNSKADATPGKAMIDLRAAGPMRVELPQPRPKRPNFVGPPAPPQPTMVYFTRDVVVLQVKPGQSPDQLNSDNLTLTLMQAGEAGPKSGEAKGDDGASEELGGGLALRVAQATGHAVWLQSKSQGFTARCNGLIHKKLLPQEPDSTYLWADQNGKIRIDKVDLVKDGPEKGKTSSVTTIRTVDATIFENGTGSDNATIVARGPGILETRPQRDKPVERTAIWQDYLVQQTDDTPGKPVRKTIKLKGQPEFIDVKQATLDANDEVLIVLRPKPKPLGPAEPKAPGEPEGEAFQIEKLTAIGDVHLKSPGKTMTARDRLDAEFESDAPSKVTSTGGPATKGAPAKANATATAKAADPNKPAEEAKPGNEPEPPPQEPEPEIVVRANRVWALIHQNSKPGPGAPNQKPAPGKSAVEQGSAEVKMVRLRGNVLFHQDPPANKQVGIDVQGEALDLTNLGNNKSKVNVINRDPNAKMAEAEIALLPAASVTTDEMKITGPVIGLDQSTDRAWVIGRGTLTQMADRGLFSEKGLDNQPDPNPKAKAKPNAKPVTRTSAKPVADAKENGKAKAGEKDAKVAESGKVKQPMTISWDDEMRFFGKSTNSRGEPVAKAQFFKKVRATMEDAFLSCDDVMETYMDRVVELARPAKPKSTEPQDEAEQEQEKAKQADSKPQIAEVRCFEKVLIITRKLHPEDQRYVVQQQVIEGEKVAYDKLSGNFYVNSAGKVYLWNRDGEGDTSGGMFGGGRAGVARVPVTPTANPGTGPGAGRQGARRQTPVIGHATNPITPDTVGGQGKPKAQANKGLNLPPLKLTQVSFSKAMKGRYLAGKDTDKTEMRWADFWGDVQALNAKVTDTSQPLKFDELPADGMFLTAQTMRVISEPSSSGDGSSRNFLRAWEDAQARTKTESIQADVITYDSLKELFYAYGLENHEVVITRQETVGQPVSTGNGEAVEFNRKTGESQIIGAREFQFVDAKSGVRPGPAPESRITPPKPVRAPLVLPGNSTIERRGMNGR